jgi:hypothetical protein
VGKKKVKHKRGNREEEGWEREGMKEKEEEKMNGATEKKVIRELKDQKKGT